MIKFFSICTILKLNITDPKKDLHKEKYKNKKIDLQICYREYPKVCVNLQTDVR